MGQFRRLLGTILDVFHVGGSKGPRLEKGVDNIMEVRNPDGSALSRLQGDDPQVDEDFVTQGFGIVSSLVGNGLQGGSGVNVSVKPDGDSIAVSPAGVKAGILTKDDKCLTPLATSGDGSPTGITLTRKPVGGTFVQIIVNLLGPYALGDGTKVGVAFYFSNDGGITAKSINALNVGDPLFYNGATVGYELSTSDRIDLIYLSTVN